MTAVSAVGVAVAGGGDAAWQPTAAADVDGGRWHFAGQRPRPCASNTTIGGEEGAS